MELKVGARLRSQVCTSEVVAIRLPAGAVELGCGGAPLIPSDEASGQAPFEGGPAAGLDAGTLLGKRYTTAEPTDLELLAVKAGTGTLTADGVPLVLKDARPLPASD